MSCLPVHPRPRPDESLSSLVLRSCRANGVKPQSFAHRLLKYLPFWRSDPDRLNRSEVLSRLSNLILLPPDRLRAATLPSLAGRLFRTHTRTGNTRWVMPIGIYHSERRRLGQQFCAACLREDVHVRLSWRLAFHTCCPTHGTLLQDCCPGCGAAVAFHRRDINVFLKNEVNVQPITRCWHCDVDLAETIDRSEILPAASRFQALLTQVQMGEVVKCADLEHPGLEVAAVAAQLLKLVASRRHQLYRTLSASARPDGWSGPPPTAIHERLGVQQRHALQALVEPLIQDLSRLVNVCAEAGLSASWVLRDMPDPPAWFTTPVIQALGRKTDFPNFASRWDRGRAGMTSTASEHAAWSHHGPEETP